MSLFHTNSRGPDETAIARAVSQATSLAQQAGHNTCRIAVHTKDSFLKGVFSAVYGAAFVKAVTESGRGTLQGCQFYLTTEKITPSVPANSPIIAVHVNTAWLESLITGRGQAAVIYLPWTSDELQACIATHPNSQEV